MRTMLKLGLFFMLKRRSWADPGYVDIWRLLPALPRNFLYPKIYVYALI